MRRRTPPPQTGATESNSEYIQQEASIMAMVLANHHVLSDELIQAFGERAS